MVIKDFFPTPILFHRIDKNIADQIEELIVSRIDKLSLFDGVYTDFDHDKKIVSIEEISLLYNEILKCKSYFEQQTGFKPSDLGDYWVQNYTQNQSHKTHNHGRNQLSIVYWVRSNENAGKFVFHTPTPQQTLFHGNIPENDLTQYNSIYFKQNPIKGGLLIFPGYLDHEVESGKPNCVRTTIAFNFTPKTI